MLTPISTILLALRIPTWEADHLDAFLKIGLPIHIWNE